jgi:hypothetical protein
VMINIETSLSGLIDLSRRLAGSFFVTLYQKGTTLEVQAVSTDWQLDSRLL